jgi:NAD(P)-dependent dehydrogenase (short-subunit alcohol dehydrogenase family)
MSLHVVTGANRGIGLELCRQLVARGSQVLAVCRAASPELHALGVRVAEGVDLVEERAIRSLAERLRGERVEALIQNAGILERSGLDALDVDAIRRQFEVNALAPLRLTHALLPCLGRGARIVFVTSLMGSMGDNGSGGYYGYRMSKAALNAAAVSLARDLSSRGIAVAILHPGMVATEMTGGRGIPVAQAAAGLIARMDETTLESSGRFRHADGRELPW